jgi:hypothetical protein
LLHGLETHSGEDSLPDLGVGGPEEVEVADLAESSLSLESHGDIEALLVNLGRVDRSGGKDGKRLSSLLLSALEEEVSRRLREEEHLREEGVGQISTPRGEGSGALKKANVLRRRERQPRRTGRQWESSTRSGWVCPWWTR